VRAGPEIAAGIGAAVIGASALGCVEAGPPVEVVARGGGAGYWPADSRTAVVGAIALARGEAPVDAIELDVALTRDRVPVFSPAPLLDPRRCRRADGGLLAESVLIRQRTAEVLAENFVCGGEPDPDHEQAVVIAEPLLAMGGLIGLLREAPGALDVWIDVRRQPGLTARAEPLAQEVLERWFAADLPQTLVVTSAQPEVLQAFDVQSRVLGVDVARWLVVPDPNDGVDDGFAAEVDGWAAGVDYVAVAEEAGADGILLRWDLVEPRLLRAARQAGLPTGLWTVDDPRELERAVEAREVDVVLTSYPGDAP
jgi:glycerophosphoryl diester phosphodiesterase